MGYSVGRRTCLISAILIGGCAGVPADLGRSDVDALLAARGQITVPGSAQSLAALVEQPLTRESAVRIALLNNPELQSIYATLGFGAADVYQAGRIRNPVFSGALLDADVAGERDQLTLGLATSFTDLLTLSARTRLSRAEFAALQQSVGAHVLQIAADAESTYYRYVGAQQVASLRAQVARAGALSAALAQRFRDAGNLTPRELAVARAAASEARLDALRAEAEAFATRTDLATVLGLSVGASWQAPAQLHLPLEKEDELHALLTLAKASRLDLAAAHTQADVTADRLGVANWTRWLGDLDVGVERERETDGTRLTGPTVDWEVPLFNQHRDAILRATADLEIALADVRRITIGVDNQVRVAFAGVENARARVTEYRDVLIPQRIETVARGQEEVNYMLIGIFELISLKQDEYDTYQGYLEAIRDYWLARTQLALATGTALPSRARITDQRIDVDKFIQPASGTMDHSGHGQMARPDGKKTDHSNRGRMDQSGDRETDHSGHGKMKSSDKNQTEHSGHEGMDHSSPEMRPDPSMQQPGAGGDPPQHNDGESP